MIMRPRRLRKSAAIRKLVEETRLCASQFVLPIFVHDHSSDKVEVKSMPGVFRHNVDSALKNIEMALTLGISSFIFFPAINDSKKTSDAAEALNQKGLIPQLLLKSKKLFPEITLFSDIALDPYNSDGHDGLVKNGKILNDETIEILCKQAELHSVCGVDFVAPSDMMDGRIGAIRRHLDTKGFSETGILSYSAKYASAFYGPFRDALDSAPRFGDKKTYQMNPANRIEALREGTLDVKEGADILMIKPALSYLDIISDFKRNFKIPIAAYQVSGEYSMIKAAGLNNWIDSDKVMLESLLSIKRAGGDIIFSYAATQVAEALRKSV